MNVTANLPFTEDDLRRAAGPASYARGLGYLERVEDLEITGRWVTATVYGKEAYEVRLRFSGRWVRGECSCPFGAEGNFCKHCVATGLAALKRGGGVLTLSAAPAPDRELESLVSWLTSLSRDELLTELVELLVDEPDLIRRFELRATAAQAADGAQEQADDDP